MHSPRRDWTSVAGSQTSRPSADAARLLPLLVSRSRALNRQRHLNDGPELQHAESLLGIPSESTALHGPIPSFAAARPDTGRTWVRSPEMGALRPIPPFREISRSLETQRSLPLQRTHSPEDPNVVAIDLPSSVGAVEEILGTSRSFQSQSQLALSSTPRGAGSKQLPLDSLSLGAPGIGQQTLEATRHTLLSLGPCARSLYRFFRMPSLASGSLYRRHSLTVDCVSDSSR